MAGKNTPERKNPLVGILAGSFFLCLCCCLFMIKKIFNSVVGIKKSIKGKK